MADATEPIVQYFAAQSARDFAALVELFTDDAVVVDEDKTWTGKNEIREWRDKAASVYEYTTEVRSVKPAGKNNFIAEVHLEGNFPGGNVDLEYRFTVEGRRIQRLMID